MMASCAKLHFPPPVFARPPSDTSPHRPAASSPSGPKTSVAAEMLDAGGGELVGEVVIPSSGSGEVMLIQQSGTIVHSLPTSSLPATHSIVFHQGALPQELGQGQGVATPSGTKTRRFYCQECNRDFNNQYGLSNHYTKTHKTDRDPRYIRKINHQRHRKAAYLKPEMLYSDPNGVQWSLPAETDPQQQYLVNMIVGPDECQCTITCNYIDCKVCLCRFICNCTEWPADDIPCQHIHFVHMVTRDKPIPQESLDHIRSFQAHTKGKEERAELKERFYPGCSVRQKRRATGSRGGTPAVTPKKAKRARGKGDKPSPRATDAWGNQVYQEEEDDGRYYMEDELWAFRQKMDQLNNLVHSLTDPQNVARASQVRTQGMCLEEKVISYVTGLEGRRVEVQTMIPQQHHQPQILHQPPQQSMILME